MTYVNEADLQPGKRLIFRGEQVMYVGCSQFGGFVVERDVRTLKDKPRFENTWPFELHLPESKKHG
jgi:hypothetical protein